MTAENANLKQDASDIFRLKPKMHSVIREFLDQSELVHMLGDGFGSPLNIMFPQNVDENIKSFQDAYKKNHLRGKVYFTSKPCKSKSIVRHASLSNIGIDVSSPASLNHVLACGFSPDRIEATGPKNPDYILTCLQLDVLLNVDSIPELYLIQNLRKKLGLSRKARVMVRISGFSSPRMRFTPQDNTFGIHTKDISNVMDWLVQHKEEIDFQGFAFYLSGINEQQRFVAIENQLELTFAAIKRGLKPKGIDIGGGFAIQYADSAKEWDEYVESLKASIANEDESLTWNNSGLGFKNHNGVVAGGPMFINHCPKYTKGDELNHWLTQRNPNFGNTTFAELIRDSMLELYIEPGRGMLDQCGITLGKVSFVKQSTWGETLVGLDMNRSNIHSMNLKQLSDPVLVQRNKRIKQNTTGVYYIGNLCVSYDILQYNKTFSEIMPEAGDIVAFSNTAAYMMDFVESETLMQPVAKKIAVWKDGNKFRWSEDEKYLPVNIDEVRP